MSNAVDYGVKLETEYNGLEQIIYTSVHGEIRQTGIADNSFQAKDGQTISYSRCYIKFLTDNDDIVLLPKKLNSKEDRSKWEALKRGMVGTLDLVIKNDNGFNGRTTVGIMDFRKDE